MTITVHTHYRAILSEGYLSVFHAAQLANIQPPPPFKFNDYDYTPKTREVLIWVLDQLPKTQIQIADNKIVATFADKTDATAFRVRWG